MKQLYRQIPEVLAFWRDAADHDGPKRFFVSLHGANVCRHMGPDFNRKYLEDVVPAKSLPFSLAPYIESIKRKAPVYAVMAPTLTNGLHSKLERLVMPFSGDNDNCVERFLVWVAPYERPAGGKIPFCEEDAAGARGSTFTLYEFQGDSPVEIKWRRGNPMRIAG